VASNSALQFTLFELIRYSYYYSLLIKIMHNVVINLKLLLLFFKKVKPIIKDLRCCIRTAYYRLAPAAACFYGNGYIDCFFLQVSPASVDILRYS